MTTPLLGVIPSFQKLGASRIDDWIDRVSHVYTVGLLVIFAVVVSTSQFVGDPIHCWNPAEFTGAYDAYTKSYCWIKNTYYIPLTESIPVDIQKRQAAEITYYQWVPLILIFQAFMFKIPNIIWKLFNGGSGLNLSKVCKLADETQWCPPDARNGKIKNICKFMDRWLQTHREYHNNIIVRIKAKASRVVCCVFNKRQGTFLTALYIWIKILFLANVISQFFILNAFMATNYNMYGFEYLKMLQSGTPMQESPRFPRITLCDFQIRQLQNIQRWTVQCVLPINLFNEKIFIFLWFWFFVVAVLAGINLFRWLYLIVLKRNNYKYVKKFLLISSKIHNVADKKLARRFADEYLRDDGCFVVRMVGLNSTDLVITDLLEELFSQFKEFKEDNEPKPHEYIPTIDEEKLDEKEKTNGPFSQH